MCTVENKIGIEINHTHFRRIAIFNSIPQNIHINCYSCALWVTKSVLILIIRILGKLESFNTFHQHIYINCQYYVNYNSVSKFKTFWIIENVLLYLTILPFTFQHLLIFYLPYASWATKSIFKSIIRICDELQQFIYFHYS